MASQRVKKRLTALLAVYERGLDRYRRGGAEPPDTLVRRARRIEQARDLADEGLSGRAIRERLTEHGMAGWV